MRIFHLVPNMNFGGLQELVRALSLSQQRAGHSVTIGCWTHVSNNPAAEAQLQAAGVQVVYLRRGPKGERAEGPKYFFLKFLKLKQHLGRGNADILHVHNPFFYYLYGALAARAAGSTKVVETLHHHIMFDSRRKWRTAFRAAAALSDVVVSVCDELETEVRRRFSLPAQKLAVIENGIELDRFLAVAPRPDRSGLVIGTIGRMYPEKNQSVLLDAFARLRATHRNVRLRILGRGYLEPALRDQAKKLGLEDAVDFAGVTNDVPAYLETLDIFVLPSGSEAMPLSLLEAIASGLPVVATSVGNMARIVEITESGWVCPPGNAGALAAALESAVTCQHLKEKGELARKKVSEYYSTERMRADYDKLYLKLVGNAD